MGRTILLLHSSAGLYGADLQLAALTSGLASRGYNTVAVLPERGQLADLLERSGATVLMEPLAVLRRADTSPKGLVRLARAQRAARRSLLSAARPHKPALVHSNTSVILSGEPLAHALGIPHLVHVREIYPQPAVLWPLFRRRLLRADCLACVSDAVARQFEDSPKAAVVHDGLPREPHPHPRAQARRALGLPEDRFVVAVLGRISAWKGQDVLARALAELALAEIGAIGLIAGAPWPGAEEPLRRLERLGHELELHDRLRLLGFRPDVDLVLGAADAVAVPSTQPDPLPNSALESAAAGLPLVVAAHGGLPEIITDDETGLLVPPADAAALATALRSLADDPERAAALGRAAAADVNARFTAERMLDGIEAAYERLLG